jgi:hypothetical protein
MAQKDNSAAPPVHRRLWRQRIFRIAIYLAVFLVVTLYAVRIGVKLYLEDWLLENGADVATIEKVQINPFTGVVALHGADVQKDGRVVFSDATIYANVSLIDLLSKSAFLQQVTLANIVVEVEKYEDGRLRIGSYTLPAAKKKVDTPKEVAQEVEKAAPWIFHAQEVDIANVTLRYRQPELEAEIIIENARLDKFNTDPDNRDGALKLDASFNGAPIQVDLTTLSIVPSVEIGGKVSIADFRLDDLEGALLKLLSSFKGTAGLTGDVRFVMNNEVGMEAVCDGLVKVSNADISGSNWATNASVNLDGKASFTMTGKEIAIGFDGKVDADDTAFDMPRSGIAIENADLAVAGNSTVTIGDGLIVKSDASFDLAGSKFAMKQLGASAATLSWNGNVHLDTGNKNRDFTIQTDGHISAGEATFEVPGTGIDIENADLSVKGKNLITIAQSVLIDSDASLQLAGSNFAMSTLGAQAEKLSWNGTVRLDTGNETTPFQITAEGKLLADAPSYQMDMENGRMTVSDNTLSWDGRYEHTMARGDNTTDTIITEGTLAGEAIAVSLPEVIDITQPVLNVTGKTQISLGKGAAKGMGFSYQGDINLEGSRLQTAPITMGYQRFSWSGDAGYTLRENKQEIALNGELNLSDLIAELPQSGLSISEAAITGKPELKLTLADESAFSGKIDLDLGKLMLKKDEASMLALDTAEVTEARDDGSGGLTVAAIVCNQLQLPSSEQMPVQVSIPAITIEEISSADLKSVNVSRIEVEKPRVTDGEGEKELVRIASIQATSLQAGQDSGLVIDTITIDSVYSEFLRQKPAEDVQSPPEEGKEEETPDVQEKKTAAGIPIKINQINVTGNSGFKYTDEALARTFVTAFAIDSLNVRNLDLATPEQPFSMELKGTFDKYSPLTISGTCAPLAQPPILALDTELRNYSLLHVSPYVVEAIGSYFTQGELDLTSALQITGDELDLQNDVLLKDVEAQETQGALAEKLDNQLPVPFDLALSLLRDGDGNVELSVPISGQLSELSVGLSDIIFTPIIKAMNVALIPYLAYTALGPTGALVLIGAKMGKNLLKTDLPSLKYDPRQIELTEKQKETLQKVGKKIAADSGQNYSICARVTLSELGGGEEGSKENKNLINNDKTRRELFELGESRSLAVKAFLLNTFQIEEERLLICNPGINFDKGGMPTIEFKK